MGKYLAKLMVVIFAMNFGADKATIAAFPEYPKYVEWHPANDRIAIADKDVWVYDSETLLEILHIPLNQSLNAMDWHPTENILALLIGDGTYWDIEIWDVDSQQMLLTIHKQDERYTVPSLEWDPNGGALAVGLYQKVELWDTSNSELLNTIPDFEFEVSSIAWDIATPSTRFVTTSFSSFQLWSLEGD